MLELIDGRSTAGPVHVSRPRPVGGEPLDAVGEVLQDVRLRGDRALFDLTERFDGARLDALKVPETTISKAKNLVRPELLDAIEVMAERLQVTHERQVRHGWNQDRGGGTIGELVRPLRRVGVYVPGGRASYPSSVVMAAVPAKVAGVEDISVTTPPRRDGSVPEAVLAACAILGVDQVYRVGGAQAIAALAFGTESVRPVDKIVGPGNIYVTLAKRLVRSHVGVDSEAGPSEIAIVADSSEPPEILAADLVAQAEHGPLGVHVLITWEPRVAEAVMGALDNQILGHPRGDDVENALIEGGRAVIVRNLQHAMATANALAPEHLQLSFTGAEDVLDDVRNAGAVFVGSYTPVPVGDYVGGTNHILPAGGTARWMSGLGVGDFTKTIYLAQMEREGLELLAPHIDALAQAEGLPGHAKAVRMRLGDAGLL